MKQTIAVLQLPKKFDKDATERFSKFFWRASADMKEVNPQDADLLQKIGNVFKYGKVKLPDEKDPNHVYFMFSVAPSMKEMFPELPALFDRTARQLLWNMKTDNIGIAGRLEMESAKALRDSFSNVRYVEKELQPKKENPLTQEQVQRDFAEKQNVIIPEGFTKIDDMAFVGCSKTEFIKIPDSVTEIGDYAFGGCHNLLDVKIPNSVTKIGENAFKNTPVTIICEEGSYADRFAMHHILPTLHMSKEREDLIRGFLQKAHEQGKTQHLYNDLVYALETQAGWSGHEYAFDYSGLQPAEEYVKSQTGDKWKQIAGQFDEIKAKVQSLYQSKDSKTEQFETLEQQYLTLVQEVVSALEEQLGAHKPKEKNPKQQEYVE